MAKKRTGCYTQLVPELANRYREVRMYMYLVGNPIFLFLSLRTVGVGAMVWTGSGVISFNKKATIWDLVETSS